MQTRYAKKLSKIRKSTVEPVLGTLINFLSMRRVNFKGIKQASKHVLMAALCYNLKKYMKYVQRKVKTMAMEQSIFAVNGFNYLGKCISTGLKYILARRVPKQAINAQLGLGQR